MIRYRIIMAAVAVFRAFRLHGLGFKASTYAYGVLDSVLLAEEHEAEAFFYFCEEAAADAQEDWDGLVDYHDALMVEARKRVF